MAWKTGDKARIVKDDPVYIKHKYPSRIGQIVEIKATNCGGYANLKVCNQQGDIFYCRPSWLRKPNQPADRRKSKSIKAQAADLAEKRMKELEEKVMSVEAEKNLPAFSDVSAKFFALSDFAKTVPENQINDIVLHLAEKQLFNEIKNGVVWDGE